MNDIDVEGILENQEIPDDLLCLQEEVSNSNPPNSEPEIEIDQNGADQRNFTLEEEDNIIEMYESGLYMNSTQLHVDYISIIGRQNAEYAANPGNETQDSSDTETIDETSSNEDESLELTIDENMDTPPEYYLENIIDSNESNDESNHYCGLVYICTLNPEQSHHPNMAEHFENDSQLETTINSFWTHKLDVERMNELESSQADIILFDHEDDGFKDCFTQTDLQNLRGEQSDEEQFQESAFSAQAEFGNYAAVNKIYHGPAHSLEHGWLIDSGASCHMTPFKSDLSNIRPCKANVTVADGSKIQSSFLGDVTILLPTNEDEHNAARIKLTRVLYVSGLNKRLFSVPTFTKLPGHEMTFYENRVHIILPDGKTVDVPVNNEKSTAEMFANPAITRQSVQRNLPERQIMTRNSMRLWNNNEKQNISRKRKRTKNKPNKPNDPMSTTHKDSVATYKQRNPQQINNLNPLPRSAAVDLDLLHDRLGHRKTTAIITASHHRV